MTHDDLQILGQMVSSIGFPIACCVMLWRYITTTMKDVTETMVKNTEVLTKLLERMEEKDG